MDFSTDLLLKQHQVKWCGACLTSFHQGRSVLMQETETARGVYGQSVAEKMSWTPGLSWFIPMCHQFFYVFFLRMMVWICLNLGRDSRLFSERNDSQPWILGKVLNRPRRRGKDFMTWVKSENLPPKPQRIPLPMTRRSQATSQNRDMIQYIYIYYIYNIIYIIIYIIQCQKPILVGFQVSTTFLLNP